YGRPSSRARRVCDVRRLGGQRLVDGVRVDDPRPAKDDNALLAAARSQLGGATPQHRNTGRYTFDLMVARGGIESRPPAAMGNSDDRHPRRPEPIDQPEGKPSHTKPAVNRDASP